MNITSFSQMAVFCAICSSTAGCAVFRPHYVAPSDAKVENIVGDIKRLSETYYDLTGSPADDPERSKIFDLLTVIEYNRDGNITSSLTYSAEDSVLLRREIYTYSDDGKIAFSSSHQTANNNYETTEYLYDEKGYMIRESKSGGVAYIDYNYDRKGYLKSSVTELPDGTIQTTEYKYRLDGQKRWEKTGDRKKRYTYRKGKLYEERYDESFSVFYGSDGNLASTKNIIRMITGEEESIELPAEITARYTLYDGHGNWLVREQWHEGAVVGLSVREIEYY